MLSSHSFYLGDKQSYKLPENSKFPVLIITQNYAFCDVLKSIFHAKILLLHFLTYSAKNGD